MHARGVQHVRREKRSRQERVRARVPRIDGQRFARAIDGARPMVEIEQLGHAGQRVHVLRVYAQRFRECFLRFIAVVLLQEHLAELDTRIDVRRVGRDRRIVGSERILE